MHRRDVTHGAAAGAHEDAVRLGAVAGQLHSGEQRAVGDARGAKQGALAKHKVILEEDAGQVLGRHLSGDFRAVGLVLEPHARLHVAAQALERGCGQHRLGRAAHANVKIHPAAWQRRSHSRRDVAVGDHAQTGAGRANGIDDGLVTRAVHGHDDKVAQILAQGLRHEGQHFFDRPVQQDGRANRLQRLDHGGAIGDLVTVEAGDVTHGTRRALRHLRGGDDADAVGHAFAHVGGAVDGVEGDIELRRARLPGAQVLADKDARRVVLDPFANDDLATDIEQIKDAVDRIARGGIGQLFFAPAQPFAGLQRGVLGGADELKLDQTFKVQGAAERWERRHRE